MGIPNIISSLIGSVRRWNEAAIASELATRRRLNDTFHYPPSCLPLIRQFISLQLVCCRRVVCHAQRDRLPRSLQPRRRRPMKYDTASPPLADSLFRYYAMKYFAVLWAVALFCVGHIADGIRCRNLCTRKIRFCMNNRFLNIKRLS